MQDSFTIGLAWPPSLKPQPKHWAMLALGTLACAAFHIIHSGKRRREEFAAAMQLRKKADRSYTDGQYRLAEAQSKLALSFLLDQLSPNDALLMETKNRLILAYKAQEKMPQALELVRAAFRDVTEVRENNRAAVALLAVTCSSVLAAHGQVDEAITGYEKSLELLGEGSPEYAAILAELQTLKASRDQDN